VAASTVAYTIVAGCQLRAMKQISEDNARQTDKLIDAATQIKNAGWVFSGAAQGINNAGWNAVGRLQDQANQVERSADAARSAAKTASETLQVSERAYVVIGKPTLTLDKREFDFPIVNVGRNPSGDIAFTLHGLLTQPVFSLGTKVATFPIKARWHRFVFSPIPPGIPGAATFVFPEFSATDFQKGAQIAIFAGDISYRDGLPDTPLRKVPVCLRTAILESTKEITVLSCDASEFLPKMIALDGYPNNEDQ
jgi:hypothetical protein